jgi:putative sterol carrier protein
MKTLPTPKESIMSLFEDMVVQFDEEKFHDVDLTYQFIFADIEGGLPVFIRFFNGAAEFREGYCESPSVTVSVPSGLWLDICAGRRNPAWALITKKLTVKGALSHFRLMPKLLKTQLDISRSATFVKQWTKPATVLVLIGNPRRKNGLTYFYLQPFLEGMRDAGVSFEEIHLYDKTIKSCLGCFHCWTKTPGVCVQKDDQQELNEKLDRADLIVYAMPLYYFSMPGHVKNHFDRQLPRMLPYVEDAHGITRHLRRNPRNQDIVLFSICGFPEIGKFDILLRIFETSAAHDNTRFAGAVLIPGAMETYYNPTNRRILLEKLNHVRSAGEQVVTTGTIGKKTLRIIARIPSSFGVWRRGANFYWYNEMEKTV